MDDESSEELNPTLALLRDVYTDPWVQSANWGPAGRLAPHARWGSPGQDNDLSPEEHAVSMLTKLAQLESYMARANDLLGRMGDVINSFEPFYHQPERVSSTERTVPAGAVLEPEEVVRMKSLLGNLQLYVTALEPCIGTDRLPTLKFCIQLSDDLRAAYETWNAVVDTLMTPHVLAPIDTTAGFLDRDRIEGLATAQMFGRSIVIDLLKHLITSGKQPDQIQASMIHQRVCIFHRAIAEVIAEL